MAQTQTKAQTEPFLQNEAAFERVFKSHFKNLHAYAFTFVKDRDVAEDMVQNTFVKLWEKSSEIEIHTSVSAYLYRSVYHECLNALKHQKVKTAYESQAKHSSPPFENDNTSGRVQLNELRSSLSEALAELPEGCRTIFQMSRFESLRYQEIADKLSISIKTVENQMGKALRILRVKLKDYLPFLLFTTAFFNQFHL